MKQVAVIFFVLLFHSLISQDTFSIVAVDSVTGEVGSAGATCLEAPFPAEGALIISDVLPGIGAIHTQAQWNQDNQNNAHTYLVSGYPANEILTTVNLLDADADSTVRQYGIAMFDIFGQPQTAAYTGDSCFDYKNHNLGSYYSIQGNILLGQHILDSMEARFLRTSGTLADRLMACMQGANVPGADSRCLNEGVPSKSAFIRVAKPTDSDTALYLHLVVKSRPFGMSPIDSLQTLFDEWKLSHPSSVNDVDEDVMKIYPNPATEVCNLQLAVGKKREIHIFDVMGKIIYQTQTFANCKLPIANWAKGIYFVRAGNQVQKLVVQ